MCNATAETKRITQYFMWKTSATFPLPKSAIHIKQNRYRGLRYRLRCLAFVMPRNSRWFNIQKRIKRIPSKIDHSADTNLLLSCLPWISLIWKTMAATASPLRTIATEHSIRWLAARCATVPDSILIWQSYGWQQPANEKKHNKKQIRNVWGRMACDRWILCENILNLIKHY